MFGVSALYHRVNWRSTRVRTWMRRLDHSTILLLIAGTYTPFALLAFDGGAGDVDPGRRLVRRGGRARAQPRLGRRADVADRARVHRARLGRRRRRSGAPRSRRRAGGAGLRRRRALHARRARVRGTAAESRPGDVRLPRDLPRVRDRAPRRCISSRSRRSFCRRLNEAATASRLRYGHDNEDPEDRCRVACRAEPGAVRDSPAQGHRARVHRQVQRHEGPRRLPLCRAAARSSSARRRSSTPAQAGRASSSRPTSTAS